MRKDIIDRKSEIKLWVSQNLPKAMMCHELNCRPATLDGYLKKFGISYKGNMGRKGYKPSPFKKVASDFLHRGSTISSHKLKVRLLNEEIKQKVCERCGNENWLGETIPLELHHINGDRFDNRISNLQLLCPNCHALTDNYSGRKTKRI
ncbi:MAG: HNH endonuclease signature motif containing protein [Pyrinomonadaceae bacterium]